MAKKVIGMSTLMLLLIVSGCAPAFEKETEVIQDTEQEAKKTVVIPSLQLDETYYQTLLPYAESSSRGLVVSNLATKYDMKEVETGLLRISQKEFPTDTYLFQEGQYLEKDTISSWLARSNQTKDGLNPSDEGLTGEEKAKNAPVYITHIVEQNYLIKEGEKVSLAGVSVGIALNSVYFYQKEAYGETFEQVLTQKQIEENGKRIAQEVVTRMRLIEGLENVPIAVGLFKQNSRNAVVPGTYFTSTVAVDGGDLGKWNSIDEEFMLFPTTESKEKHREIDTNFRNFKQDIETYFSNYTGVIGTGYYKDQQLQKLNISIPIQFYGTTEIIGFTQHLAGLLMDHFSEDVDVEVNVTSLNGAEALLIKKPGDKEPFVHIYGQ
ncbi:protein involved in sex pheromone biosynthesis [Psychrobacillus insolitus]|uniref:Protein involved in sex pheromone biosynthesis n=1 Tax=Psychrobacillus insolitus TaxID=1461 RepID=A0A2W7MZL8_9BACI|nr:CamS family sex pheromone protein [Psychrobacillus insolitus]PZX03168.1 protein involved in sex pheromone biosynthesis [Psychrobacillus insolitus]